MKRLLVPVLALSLFNPLYAGAEPRGNPIPDSIKRETITRIADSYSPGKVFPVYIDANGDGNDDKFNYVLKENLSSYPHTKYSITYQDGIGNNEFSQPRNLFSGIRKGGAVVMDVNSDDIPDLAAIEENRGKLLITLMPGWVDNSGRYTVRSEEAVYVEANR